MASFPLEVQESFMIHRVLPDRWDGMSGYYMGKDLSSLQALLDIYEIEDRKEHVYFLKHIDAVYGEMINAKVKRDQEANRRKHKSTIKRK